MQLKAIHKLVCCLLLLLTVSAVGRASLTWEHVTNSPDFALSIAYVGSKLYVGTLDHGISFSDNGGAWTSASQGLGVRLEVCGDFPTCNTAPTGGTFTITYGAQTTTAIAFNASNTTIQSALDGISSLGSGGSVVSDGPLPGSFVVITPAGSHVGDDFTTMTVNGAGLTGGSSPGGAILGPRYVAQLYTAPTNTLFATIRVRSTTDLYRRASGATRWTKVLGPSGFRYDISTDGAGNLLVVDLVNTNNVIRSTDDGVTWSNFATLANCGDDDRPLSIAFFPDSPIGGGIIAGTHGINVEFSSDGSVWNCLGHANIPTNGSNNIRAVNNVGEPLATGQYGQIYLHLGDQLNPTWIFQTGYPYSNTNYTTHDMIRLPNNTLVVHGGRPYSSTDGGSTWSLDDSGIPAGTLANFDGGGTFGTMSHTLAIGNDGKLYMAIVNQLSGWGVYRTTTSVTGTVIPVHNGDNVQTKYNSANCGDTLEFDNESTGASWTIGGDVPSHGLVLDKVCTAGNEITLRSAGYASIPNGVVNHTVFPRVMPTGTVLNNMFKFRTNNSYGIDMIGAYNHIIGLDITTVDRSTYEVSTMEDAGVHDTIDRSWPHSLEDGTNTTDASMRYPVHSVGAFLTIESSRVSAPAGYVLGSTTVDNNYAVLCETCSNQTMQNVFLSAWYAETFTGGTQFGGATHATLSPGATTTQAVFSDTTGLSIGKQIAIQQFAEPNGFAYAAATVTNIIGSTVFYTQIPGQPFLASPLTPGDAQWDGFQPHDINFTQCEFYINPTIVTTIQAQTGNSPKGFFEFKAVKTMTFDGCEFTGAASVLAWSANNQGGPNGCWSVWTTVQDVTVQNSYVNFSPTSGDNFYAFIISTQPVYIGCTNVEGHNFTVRNNLVLHSGALDSHSNGIGYTVDHNTVINDQNGSYFINFNTISTTNFVLTNNIGLKNQYGILCQLPDSSLPWPDSACFPGIDMRKNIMVGPLIPDRPYCGNPWPAGNICVDAVTNVGFVNPSLNNYRLTTGSVGHNAATDGTDIGVNWGNLVASLGFDPASAGGAVIRGKAVLSGKTVIH